MLSSNEGRLKALLECSHLNISMGSDQSVVGVFQLNNKTPNYHQLSVQAYQPRRL